MTLYRPDTLLLALAEGTGWVTVKVLRDSGGPEVMVQTAEDAVLWWPRVMLDTSRPKVEKLGWSEFHRVQAGARASRLKAIEQANRSLWEREKVMGADSR